MSARSLSHRLRRLHPLHVYVDRMRSADAYDRAYAAALETYEPLYGVGTELTHVAAGFVAEQATAHGFYFVQVGQA